MVLACELDLGLCVLEGVVEEVELDLDELHLLAVLLEEALGRLIAAVGGETQVADLLAGVAQADEVLDVAVLLRVEVGVDVSLADVVDEVHVDVFHLQALELLCEDFLVLAPEAGIEARELVGDHEAVARVAGKRLAHDDLGDSAVVAVGRVEVVDAGLDGAVDHLEGRGLVDGGVDRGVDLRQAHATHAVEAHVLVLELANDHALSNL